MKDPVRGYAWKIVAVVVSLAAGACSPPRPDRNVTNPDPAGKIPAYKQAVRTRDQRAARQMVEDLESDDPAVRMFAILGLRRLTGRTFGYRYFEDEDSRRAAVQRWEAWLAGDEPRQNDPQDAAVANDGATDASNGAPDGASGP